MKKYAIIFLLVAGSAFCAAARPTVLTLKETIQDSTIVYPESFETDTQELLKNWYLQNYTVLADTTAEATDVPMSDEDYIERLQALPTVIEMPYNQVVRSYIDMYTQRRRKLVEEMLGLSLYYMPIFEQALEKEGLPLELKYLPVIESALNPDAVSRAGATGLWQFMIGTARGLGLEVNSLVDERRDPVRSSEQAARYLKQLYGIYGDWSLAIAAYNCGPGNVNKALRRAGGGKRDFWEIYFFLPKETRGYVPAFIAANYVMTYHNDHNIGNVLAKRPVLTDTIHVNKRVHFDQIASVLNLTVDELRVLNPQYRRNIIPGDIHSYALTLPSKQVYSYIVSEDSIVSHDASLYARRSVVEPGQLSKSSDMKLVVKYHKVKRGETLSKIARKYGVTVTNLKKWNGLKSNRLRRGQNLRVNLYEKVDEEADNEPETDTAPAVATTTKAHTDDGEATSSSNDNAKPEGTLKYHKVGRGETLGKIAERYGVTVAQLQDWNNLSSTRINRGQRLKVYVGEDAGRSVDRDTQTVHKVKRGETLGSIAERYGVTVSQLKRWNGLSSSRINVGQKLTIGGSSKSKKSSDSGYIIHTVRSGETLGGIAEANGTTASAIRRANGIKGSMIRVGQKLKIPKK